MPSMSRDSVPYARSEFSDLGDRGCTMKNKTSHLQLRVGKSRTDTSDDTDSLDDAIATWRSSSSTGICRSTYTLDKLPQLYLFRITVSALKGKSKECIRSRKLRCKAIKEFLEVSEFNQVKDSVAINFGRVRADHQDHVDEIIVPLVAGQDLSMITDKVNSQEGLANLLDKVRMHPSKLDSRTDPLTVVCSIDQGAFDLIGEEHTAYLKNLEILIRSQASSKVGQEENRHSEYEANRDFFTELPKHFADHFQPRGLVHNVRPLFQDMTAVKVQLRHELSVGRRAHETPSNTMSVGDTVLNLDHSLVPVIRSFKRVTDVLLQLFGTNILGTGLAHEFDKIKHILLGLHVRCTYVSNKREDLSISASTIPPETGSGLFQKSPGRELGRRGIIADIKLPGDIASFSLGDQKYTVAKYFNDLILPKDEELEYQNLPLANIGKNGRKVWVPLEMLMVNHPQLLRRPEHLIDDVIRQKDIFIGNPGWEEIIQKSEAKWLLGASRNSILFECKSRARRAHALIYKPEPINQSSIQRTANLGAHRVEKMAIIYVAPESSKFKTVAQVAFLEEIAQDLHDIDGNILIHNQKPTIQTVDGWEKLITQQWNTSAGLGAMIQEDAPYDVLFGVVDDRGRNRAEIRNIYAELNRLANRQLKTVIVNTTLQILEGQIRDNRASERFFFPTNIMRKMNFMMGNFNFNIGLLRTPPVHSKRVMVMGAHIAHAGSGALKHTPSVAAIVASTNINPNLYPGSARFQPRLRGSDKADKRIENTEITNLDAMMRERFEAWQEMNPAPELVPTDVLFYRDSLSFDDKHSNTKKIIAAEKDIITKAFAQVFPNASGMSLTYITMNKNTTKGFEQDANQIEEHSVDVRFTTEVSEVRAKYLYRVFGNGLGLDKITYGRLTDELNQGSQLASRVAVALPLFYAKKLSHRMFEYVYWFQTRDLRHVPYAVRRLNEKTDDAANSSQAVEIVKKHLFGRREIPNSSGHSIEYKNGELPWAKTLNHKMFYL